MGLLHWYTVSLSWDTPLNEHASYSDIEQVPMQVLTFVPGETRGNQLCDLGGLVDTPGRWQYSAASHLCLSLLLLCGSCCISFCARQNILLFVACRVYTRAGHWSKCGRWVKLPWLWAGISTPPLNPRGNAPSSVPTLDSIMVSVVTYLIFYCSV